MSKVRTHKAAERSTTPRRQYTGEFGMSRERSTTVGLATLDGRQERMITGRARKFRRGLGKS